MVVGLLHDENREWERRRGREKESKIGEEKKKIKYMNSVCFDMKYKN